MRTLRELADAVEYTGPVVAIGDAPEGFVPIPERLELRLTAGEFAQLEDEDDSADFHGAVGDRFETGGPALVNFVVVGEDDL